MVGRGGGWFVRLSVAATLVVGGVGAAPAERVPDAAPADATTSDAATSDAATDASVTADTTAATVSIAVGPTEEVSFVAACDDAVHVVDQATSFVLSRTGELGPLEVAVRAGGSAVSGEHLAPVPDTVVFPAGAAEATVSLEVQPTPTASVVDLRLEVAPGEGYTPVDPVHATATFTTPQAAPVECGFRIAGGPDLTRATELGGKPDPIVVEEMVAPVGYLPITDAGAVEVQVVDGALPAGLTLGTDGRFAGVARRPGITEATVEACRSVPPGTCTTADVVLTVAEEAADPPSGGTVTGRADELPATGAPVGWLALVAAALVGAGVGALRRYARSANGPQLRS